MTSSRHERIGKRELERILISSNAYLKKSRFLLKNIEIHDTYITASLYFLNEPCKCSYMSEIIQTYVTSLAIFLRDYTDRNQFFDIVWGQFTLFTPDFL